MQGGGRDYDVECVLRFSFFVMVEGFAGWAEKLLVSSKLSLGKARGVVPVPHEDSILFTDCTKVFFGFGSEGEVFPIVFVSIPRIHLKQTVNVSKLAVLSCSGLP